MTHTRQQVLDCATACTDDGRVDVIKLATKLGIDVYAITSNNPDYNAQIEYDKVHDRFKITVNENHPETRRRFSVAHEISHYVLDTARIKQAGKLDRSTVYVDEAQRDMEQQADQLAAEILMPETKIKDYLQEHGQNELTINASVVANMARHFHVSKGMVITRLRNMDYSVPYLTFA